MPRKERRRQWRELESNLGFKLPLLAPTPLVFWGTTAILWLASVPSALRGKRDMWVLLIGLGGFLFLSFIAAAILTRPLWTKLPCATMGELAKTIVRDHFVRFSPGGATDGEVRETLLEIISHQLGVEKTQILAESRFVEDLNAD